MRERLAALRATHKAERDRDSGLRNTIDSMRLSIADVDELASMCSGPRLRGEALDPEWTRLIESPPPLPRPLEDKLDELEARIEAEDGPKPVRPWWNPILCVSRYEFLNTALYDADDADIVYKFVVAKIQPRVVVFLRCSREHQTAPDLSKLSSNVVEDEYDPLLKVLDYSGDRYLMDTDVNFSDDSRIMVLPGLKFVGDRLVSRHDAVCFEDFLRGVRRPTAAPRDRGDRPDGVKVQRKRDIDAYLLEEFPWLTAKDLDVREAPPGVAREKAADKSDVEDADTDGEPPELYPPVPAEGADDVDDALALLAERRAEWNVDYSELAFFVRILGGKWTKEHCKVFSNAVACFLCKYAAPSCKIYTWQQQRTFHYAKFTGEGAMKLAHAWTQKGDWFFGVWMGQDDDYYTYSDEDLASFVPDDDFLTWSLTLDVESPAFRAVHEYMHTQPSKPVPL